jgi:hypothetical protein
MQPYSVLFRKNVIKNVEYIFSQLISLQVSGRWLPVTGCRPEARSQKQEA